MCVCMHANDVFTCVMQSVSALLSTRSLCVTFTFTFFSLLGKAVDASVGQPRSHAKLIRNQHFVTALGGAQGIFWRLGLTHKVLMARQYIIFRRVGANVLAKKGGRTHTHRNEVWYKVDLFTISSLVRVPQKPFSKPIMNFIFFPL